MAAALMLWLLVPCDCTTWGFFIALHGAEESCIRVTEQHGKGSVSEKSH